MWSPDYFLEKLYSVTAGSGFDASTGSESVFAGQQALRKRVMASLGAFPECRASLQSELLEVAEHGGLIIEKLAYSTYEGMRVPAYALYPKDRKNKLPAVLACHGHGIGQRSALGMNPDGTFAADPGIHNRFAVELAQRGMFVLVPEIIGFGDRRLRASVESDSSAKDYSCAPIAMQLLMCGMTIAGFRAYEAVRGLDYLSSRGEVDHERIGTFGFSGGGLIASLTAAVDERIRATVLCGYANTYKGSILHRLHCVDNYIPGILLHAEQPEIIGLIAPRPLFVESGEQDEVFPIESAKEAIRRLTGIYRSFGAEHQLDFDLFSGGHEISGRESFDWLKSRLSS
ncbi:dienelactone hydrolase family protein [Paenibacillus alba]|nr:dienelactone hydrolase family protein [Paenibacillus alba]